MQIEQESQEYGEEYINQRPTNSIVQLSEGISKSGVRSYGDTGNNRTEGFYRRRNSRRTEEDSRNTYEEGLENIFLRRQNKRDIHWF